MNQVPFRVIMLGKTDLKLDSLSFLTLTEPGLVDNCLVSIVTQVIIRDKRETHSSNYYFVNLRHNVLCT